jgi:glucosamine--fructose-6-phosphate aminotransferase (isomerizing)
MCGIVGAVAERNIVPILIEGLRRLEYRGYDSAGVAVLNGTGKLSAFAHRRQGADAAGSAQPVADARPHRHRAHALGHARRAEERNAHPHISRDGLAIVHNGIIENHEELRRDLERLGYKFTSETDTEVIAHRIHHHLQTLGDLFKAVRATVAELEGAYALAVRQREASGPAHPRAQGCPVVVGLGER